MVVCQLYFGNDGVKYVLALLSSSLHPLWEDDERMLCVVGVNHALFNLCSGRSRRPF